MNYLYAKLNKEAEKLKYKGVNTATVNMNVDNKNYTISADVKNVHDSRIPELTGEEGFCVPFVNEEGTAFQIGSLPAACLNTNCVTTEKIANDAVTLDKMGADVLSKIPGITLSWPKSSYVAMQSLQFVANQPTAGGSFNLDTTGLNYDTMKEIIKTMRPCYAIFSWNIDWVGQSGTPSPYRRNTVLLREVDRKTAEGNINDIWQVVLEGDAGGYRYTITISFAHMQDMIYYFDSIICNRTLIAPEKSLYYHQMKFRFMGAQGFDITFGFQSPHSAYTSISDFANKYVRGLMELNTMVELPIISTSLGPWEKVNSFKFEKVGSSTSLPYWKIYFGGTTGYVLTSGNPVEIFNLIRPETYDYGETLSGQITNFSDTAVKIL